MRMFLAVIPPQAAIEDLDRALSFARSRKTGLEAEARILADLANAYRLKGDLDKARGTAVEAIEVACARAGRIPECLARIVHAEVLIGVGEAEQALQELPKIRSLMAQTGVRLYEPLLRDLAAKLELGPGPRHADASQPRLRNGGSCA